MLASLATILLLASSATASWDANINYQSPSRRHASLGVDIPKVLKRSTGIFKRSTRPQSHTPATSSWSADQLNFTNGVASGDPWPHSVILWTRISPQQAADDSNITVEGTVPLYSHDTEQYIEMASKRACVNYVVGKDKKLSRVVSRGTAFTTSDIDFTVKVYFVLIDCASSHSTDPSPGGG